MATNYDMPLTNKAMFDAEIGRNVIARSDNRRDVRQRMACLDNR
jgi:hypothetical protein